MAVSSVKATINGVEHNLAYNAVLGKYEAYITAPPSSSHTLSGGYYPVTVSVTANGVTYTYDDTDAAVGNDLCMIVGNAAGGNDILLLDGDFSIMGISDLYSSFVLSRRYHECGSWTLTLRPDCVTQIMAAKYIYHTGAGVCLPVDTIEYTHDESGTALNVRGRALESLFHRRIVTPSTASGNIENRARTLINSSALTGARAFGGLSLDAANGYTDTGDITTDTGTLADALYSTLQPHGMSFYVRYDMADGKFHCGITRGADRSGVIFSTSFDNLRTSEFYRDSSDYANCFYIEHDGTITEVDLSGGIDRREAYLSVSGLTDLTGSALSSALTAKANEAAKERKVAESLTGTAEIANPIYKQDYDLGDIVTVREESLGLTIQKRITAIDEVWENGKALIYPSFGDIPNTSITKLIKRGRTMI